MHIENAYITALAKDPSFIATATKTFIPMFDATYQERVYDTAHEMLINWGLRTDYLNAGRGLVMSWDESVLKKPAFICVHTCDWTQFQENEFMLATGMLQAEFVYRGKYRLADFSTPTEYWREGEG